jgi:hypothetical protein
MTTPEQKSTKAKKPTGNIEGKKVAQGLEQFLAPSSILGIVLSFRSVKP